MKQMQASVEQIAAGTVERFQQLEMQINKVQQAQAIKPMICCLEECQKPVSGRWYHATSRQGN
jgi:membrane protein insertase Oxa1/YidC/SpoIIIJ